MLSRKLALGLLMGTLALGAHAKAIKAHHGTGVKSPHAAAKAKPPKTLAYRRPLMLAAVDSGSNPMIKTDWPQLPSGLAESVHAGLQAEGGPEPLFNRAIAALRQSNLEAALQQTESLIRQYPNFRLAHLLKGDLLLAKARPLSTFGAAPNAPADRLTDLREEAMVRIKAYQERPQETHLPRYLLQLQPNQQHAILVDAQRSRLYVYANDNGRPRFLADYYVTQGKSGADKLAEGDKKTPVGVYHVTASLPRKSLTDLYGHGAFPINYPNEWDKRQGRGGSGIWLHGTPSDTYSRPPKASDGCVVLTNHDLDIVAKNLQVGLTPVIISNQIEWLSVDDWNSERSELNQAIDTWRSDWESLDTDRYLKHYSRKFQSPDQNYEQWSNHKRKVNGNKEWVKVQLGNLSVLRNPGREEIVVVTFDQDYRSSNLSNAMKKRQYWMKENGAWKIIYEGAA